MKENLRFRSRIKISGGGIKYVVIVMQILMLYIYSIVNSIARD